MHKTRDASIKDQLEAVNDLLDGLDALGVVTVREGVLENFLKTANAKKGPEWLSVAFAQGAHKSPAAQEQAKRLLKAAGITLEEAPKAASENDA